MRVRYFPLFTVECLHDYFAAGRCGSLGFRPTPACQRLLEQYQCLFKPMPGGRMVVGATQDSVNVLTRYDERTPFAFDLVSSDPSLLTYTDSQAVPGTTTSAESVHYFSNLEDHPAPDQGAKRQLLHPAGQALAQPPLPVRPRRFTLPAQASAEISGASIVDEFHDEPMWHGRPSRGGGIAVDLGALPDGRYRLRRAGQDDQFFYLSDAAAASRWGVVEIFPGGLAMSGRVPENCRIIDAAGHPSPKHFTLWLNSRRSFWRYYIIHDNAEDRTYDSFRVEGGQRRTAGGPDPEARFSFTEAKPRRLDGRQARVFESDQPIPLLERPGDAYEFAYRANGAGERGGRAIKLPYATTANARLEEISGVRRMCSEIYVYL
jgi:hypothetical protein